MYHFSRNRNKIAITGPAAFFASEVGGLLFLKDRIPFGLAPTTERH
jgi:hypothetical protein